MLVWHLLTLGLLADYGFGVRHGVFSPLLGHGIFTQEGAAWKHSRELLRKQFVKTQYKNLDHFREHVDNLLTCLPTSKGVVDLQPLFFKLTFDTTTALLLGQSVHSLRAEAMENSSIRSFTEGFDMAQAGLAKRFRLAPFHYLYRPQAFKRACASVHKFVDDYIEKRIVQGDQKPSVPMDESFIDQLAQESTSKESLRYQLLNILLAGRDTTACCLSWTL